MTLAGFLFALFQAIAALPGLISSMESLASSITLWYIQRQTTANLSAIADAAALAAEATTDEQRFAAAQAWRTALGGTRSLS